MKDIHERFSLLCFRDPAFGYFPEASKSFVVITEHCKTKAETLFHDLRVQVVTGR